jgi:hypothetical protein
MIQLIGVVAIFGLLAGYSIVSGYVLSVLWGWFFVPLFNAPVLPVVAAMGVAMTVNYMTGHYTKKNSGDVAGLDAVGDAAAHMVCKPLFALGIGWIIKQCM